MDRCWRVLSGALIVCLVSFGCEQGKDFKTAKQINTEKGPPVDDHGHGAAGPHGGAIVELGDEEYHGEVVVDGKTHSLTVYLFGPDAKTPAPIAAEEVTVVTEDDTKHALKAVDAKDGKASQFALSDEEKVEAIVDAGYIHGSLQLEVDGTPYRGSIDAHFDGAAHDDEKHDMPTKAEPDKQAEPAKKTDAEPETPTTEDSDDKPSTTDEKATDEKPESEAEDKADTKPNIPDPPATPE